MIIESFAAIAASFLLTVSGKGVLALADDCDNVVVAFVLFAAGGLLFAAALCAGVWGVARCAVIAIAGVAP
jgi:hypothetical protein